MKITRSTKCSLKYATSHKLDELIHVFKEYAKVVNFFIAIIWLKPIRQDEITTNFINQLPNTWLSQRMKQMAAREALDMVWSVKNVYESNKEQVQKTVRALQVKIHRAHRATKKDRRKLNNWYIKLKANKQKLQMMKPHIPVHRGKRICATALIAELQTSENSFDGWLHLNSIGNKISLDLPIKFHKHFNDLAKISKRLNSYVITPDYVQFAFQRETGPKKKIVKRRGIDTGITELAATSDELFFGQDLPRLIMISRRKKKGSKGKHRAISAIKQYICKTAKEVVKDVDLVAVERLKDMNNNSTLKGNRSRGFRDLIGSWNYSYWLGRIESNCETNRVSFRSILPYYSSQECSKCDYVDESNRVKERFRCQKCNHTGHAGTNAALNLLKRLDTGKYSSRCEASQ